MQEHVVEGKGVFVGLEDSKRTWKLCVRSGGQIVAETSMPAVYENLQGYFEKRFPGCRIEVMYEAGFGGFGLYDCLVVDGVQCVVTPPHTLTEAKVNRVKTDRGDARRLARNLESGDYRVCAVPDRELREDRQIVRTLNQVQQQITATKNRIRKLFDWHGLNAGFPAGVWTKADYERAGGLRLGPSLQVCLESYFQLLAGLESIRQRLLLELKALCEKARYQQAVAIKASCPGIGWLSAIRFTLEWGDLSRFGSGKQLASYVGLTSREYSTGETVHRGRITGQGSGIVRAWLIECSWRAIRHDPVLLVKYQAVRKRAESSKKAIVAVARKLTVRLWALDKAQQTYQVGVIQ
jgi:transposase